MRKLTHRGFALLNQVYTQREVGRMKRLIDQMLKTSDEPVFAQRQLLKVIPALKPLVINRNLQTIIRTVDPKAFLVKAIYFDKPPESNWYVSWHQDVHINVTERVETPGFDRWTHKEAVTSVCPPEEISKQLFTIRIHLDEANETNGALRVVPGSQNKQLSDQEIQLITTNSLPVVCSVPAGGVHLMKPLLLHASSKSRSTKRRRVVHLEFTSLELPGGLEWLEREEW